MTADSNVQNPEHDSSIQYRKFRSPKSNGETLQVPSLHESGKIWNSNLARVADSESIDVCGESLASLRKLGRQELIQLAVEYSGRYLAVEFSNRLTDRIVLAGHQPELFHPGVWYKNFVLSEFGRRFNCQAINLIVDGDICGSTSIRFPKVQSGQVAIGTIPIAKPGPNVPFEVRKVNDAEYFGAFGKRAEKSISPIINQPLVRKLWPQVLSAGQSLAGDGQLNLGASIAAGRHRLESEFGLNTLEVPLSLVSGTVAFAIFTKSILTDLDRFTTIYNETLIDYRLVHGIRSRSHPVPELESSDGWLEAPFWIWQKDQGVRRRLFVKRTGKRIVLTDRDAWHSEIDVANFEEQFSGLGTQANIAIRPKALMTTMFSRLVLSELFLHGIGGSKYDQLTDVIARKFFSVSLPEYYTLSATMKLPTNEPLVGSQELAAVNQQLRQLEFHPETMIDKSKTIVNTLVQKKRELISKHQGTGRTKLNHDAIVGVNQELNALVDFSTNELLAARKVLSRNFVQVRFLARASTVFVCSKKI